MRNSQECCHEWADWLHLILKYLLLMAVGLVATSGWADVLVPPPHALSQAEWSVAMRRYSTLWRLAIPCCAFAIFLGALVFSMIKKRPSIMVWLACCAPVFFLVPIACEESLFYCSVYSILGISAVSGILSVVHYFYMRKITKAVCLIFVIPFLFVSFLTLGMMMSSSYSVLSFAIAYSGGLVEPRSHETYDEYLKRANRIIYHHCKRCDKPMKEYARGHWLCPDCDKGVMSCLKCGMQKVLVPKGQYWQEGFEWKCPNCDKENSVDKTEYRHRNESPEK